MTSYVIIVSANAMNPTDQASIIIGQFAQAGYQIDPDALSIILEKDIQCDSSYINQILDTLDDSIIVIGPDHLVSHNQPKGRMPPPRATMVKATDPDYEDEWTGNLEIISDITNQSTCIGDFIDFTDYFRNRFSTLSNLLRNRGVSFRPIESLNRRKMSLVEGHEKVSVIGMVSDLRTTKNGHRLIEIEDNTGIIRTMVLKKNKDLFHQANRVMLDEVIGITGSLSEDGNMLFIDNILRPDIPIKTNTELGQKNITGKAVLISDIHIGSKTFLENEWLSFIEWLNGRGTVSGNGSIDINEIKYLIVAGDLVDGIGVYPGQENELLINDIYEQYQTAAKYFNEIPKHIKIIISPGNHDAVRQAEPQPTFSDKIKKMFRQDIIFVGNPSVISIDGVRILIYHGRSIDDFIATLPGMKYEDPTRPMVEMLKCRHLAPIYGSRVSIAPEKQDHMVIDTPPDILHCGHVHTVGSAVYRGVTVINSGAWQSQTEFQRRMNLKPDPAKATIVDLATLITKIISFQ
jgi:DNA polymerase II small subunit